ncbi:hypothetical protein [Colwellia echini]|uniref:Transporter n=1 Tax=Colwellia echini TaxID=1982103 RepID=A0ABY3MYC8_9GAMM|nr:hypothetical protein [Colwellia echini]TYK66199.1 hypothetical protein CWS31_006225 [Colwellia echini]
MKPRLINLILLVNSVIYFNTTAVNAEELEPVHYAYANYLGSGIYKTTGQNATLFSLPFSFELGKKGKMTYELRLPISLGFFDFTFSDIPNLDLPDSVGTLTISPGIGFKYQYTDNWVIESYVDGGYGLNLTTDEGVSIHSSGVSTLYYFNVKEYDSIWVNRLYYARYDGNGYEAYDTYAALQTGLDTGLPLQYQVLGYKFQPRLFATAFWYFSEVDFLTPRSLGSEGEEHVTLSNSFEFGFTLKFTETVGYSWAGIERLGLSYRFSENFSAFRLLFSFPI